MSPNLIEWRDEFRIGLPEVDEEHRLLIDAINQLHRELVVGAAITRVRLFQIILISMVIGVGVGAAIHSTATPEQAAEIAGYFKIVTDIFLRLIKMVIAPLVLTTLIVGIAHMGDSKSLGRVGLRTLLWFVGASLVSLALGLLMVNLIQPGVGFEATLPSDASGAPDASKFTLAEFVTHLMPATASLGRAPRRTRSEAVPCDWARSRRQPSTGWPR